MFKKFRSKSWYTYTVALCIAVVLYVVLIHLPAVIDGLQSFGRYFNTVVIGCIVAYLMNPLAMLYERKVCKSSDGQCLWRRRDPACYPGRRDL